ncbi:MAG: aminotransferase class III-fold pyridoxal phosphate-dependent enzyme [Thermoguttaceae bacterium]|jgi:putrescine aminotransferase|nr:aminotransferase class III-fold pyridoxal phosphate-dependent enzyme [Thermoguttaceae bacterium]
MKFAFLVHPLSEESKRLLDFDSDGDIRQVWGQDLMAFCAHLHGAVQRARCRPGLDEIPQVRVMDELGGLVSAKGVCVDGRLYEIPMDAAAILDDPGLALEFSQKAIGQAADWGARIVGLGSMTGVIGGQGAFLAECSPVPVTTGNSLTVFAALENLARICSELGIDLSAERVAVVGIPGSIATAAARSLRARCRSLCLVARRTSSRAARLSRELDAELLTDIPAALSAARIVLSATSSGACIEQSWLQPGSVVIDVAVPTDVCGSSAERDDVLILSGGLARVPETMPLESSYLWFHHGTIPSCLAETMVLALEERTECYSLGRDLNCDAIESIGAMAKLHGFDFTRPFSFGLPLAEASLVEFRKTLHRRRTVMVNGQQRDQADAEPPTAGALAGRARRLFARHINPVLESLSGKSGFLKTFVRGEGAYLWDADGKRYLDFVAGFGSLNLGHNHPVVVEALTHALREHAPGFVQAAVNPFQAALAEQLATIAPPGLEMVFFANSGAEAVEAALKLARCATGRQGLLYCERSYHGKTLGALSVTGNAAYRTPFLPLLDRCDAVPYGDLECLERALRDRRYAAFMVEPVQAEGGMIVPAPGYLPEVQRLCRRYGTLLVADEVQTGLGRTGTMFAVERESVAPDVMTLAKSLSGGLVPIGAMLARRDWWLRAYGHVDTFALHTSTFGGGSLACAAGLAALRVLHDDRLPDRAVRLGQRLLSGLRGIVDKYDMVREVRGQGLLIGLEFEPMPPNIVRHWKQVDSAGQSSFLVPGLDGKLANIPSLYAMHTLLEEHGIYTQTTRSNPRVLRIQPPLTVTPEQVDHFLAACDDTCGEIEFATKTIDGIIAKSGLGQHQATGNAQKAPGGIRVS